MKSANSKSKDFQVSLINNDTQILRMELTSQANQLNGRNSTTIMIIFHGVKYSVTRLN